MAPCPSPHAPQGVLPPASSRAVDRRGLLTGALAGGSALALSACGAESGAFVQAGDVPQRGGQLRVGMTGGSATDTADAHAPIGTPDAARCFNLYDTLFRFDDQYRMVPSLARSAEPAPDGLSWTLHLRDDVLFHDGSPFTAESVKHSIERIIDPEDPKSGAVGLAAVESVEVVDDHTARVVLSEPDVALTDTLAQYSTGMVPPGYDPAAPIGTGPFRLGAFQPGVATELIANERYWQGRPHADRVHLVNFDDDDALVNALLSGQVDAVAQVPLPLVKVIREDPRIRMVTSETGNWIPLVMRTDTAPFDDPRVRRAFKLVVDRQQMVDVAFAGQGEPANDMYSRYDPDYPRELPQRERDIERAKRLLAEAGHPDGLTVELVTAPIQAGAVESATVFAEQAADAGITVDIRRQDTTTYWGSSYMVAPFSQSFYYTRNFLPQAANTSLKDSPFNETHWDDPEFADLVRRARRTADRAERSRLVEQAQRIHRDRGGNIVFGWFQVADAYQSYVGGGGADRSGMPMSSFAFRDLWIATADQGGQS